MWTRQSNINPSNRNLSHMFAHHQFHHVWRVTPRLRLFVVQNMFRMKTKSYIFIENPKQRSYESDQIIECRTFNRNNYSDLVCPLSSFVTFSKHWPKFNRQCKTRAQPVQLKLTIICCISGVPRGQRGRFAPGGTLRGAAKKGKKKKEKKEKRKKGKKEKKRKRKRKYGRSM